MAPHSSTLLPGKSHWQRSLVGCSPWGRTESDTTEWLHFHFSLSWIGERDGNPLQCSCLENPRDGEAWWATIYGVAQSRTWLKWLRSSSKGSSANSSPLKYLEWIFIPSLFAFLFLLFFSHSITSNSLQPHGLQHARLPCHLLSPWVCTNSCALSWWCHLFIYFAVPGLSCSTWNLWSLLQQAGSLVTCEHSVAACGI